MKSNIHSNVTNLIDAHVNSHGCSRLIAAGYAAEDCLAEYNRIQKESGSTAESVIVDREWLEQLKRDVEFWKGEYEAGVGRVQILEKELAELKANQSVTK